MLVAKHASVAVESGHTRHIDEQLRHAAQGVWDRLPPQRYRRNQAVEGARRITGAVPAARVGLVSLVTQNGVPDASTSSDEETSGNASYRAVVDLKVAQQRV